MIREGNLHITSLIFVFLHIPVYCLRVFIVVLQELHVHVHCLLQCLPCMFNLLCSLNGMCIPSFVLIGYCVSELLCSLCSYRNEWPDLIYCYFKTTIFTELFTCYYHQRCRVLSLHQVSLLYTFWFLAEIAKCIA